MEYLPSLNMSCCHCAFHSYLIFPPSFESPTIPVLQTNINASSIAQSEGSASFPGALLRVPRVPAYRSLVNLGSESYNDVLILATCKVFYPLLSWLECSPPTLYTVQCTADSFFIEANKNVHFHLKINRGAQSSAHFQTST